MIETHAFGPWLPVSGANDLILGSFSAKAAAAGTEPSYDWFYAVKRNQFWPILEDVYGRDLSTKQAKQALFEELHIAIADIIQQCERKTHSSHDSQLMNIVYAVEEIAGILDTQPINMIFFTSRFAETHFRRAFKGVIERHPVVELVTLPSPSPRYAWMSREQKVQRYKELLPALPGRDYPFSANTCATSADYPPRGSFRTVIRQVPGSKPDLHPKSALIARHMIFRNTARYVRPNRDGLRDAQSHQRVKQIVKLCVTARQIAPPAGNLF